MKNLLSTFLMFLVLLSGGIDCFAQSKILVTGKLRNKDGDPIKGAYIYAFNTEEEGNYEFKCASAPEMKDLIYLPLLPCVTAMTSDEDGSYEITVNANGSMIFYQPYCTPVLVPVQNKRVHNPRMDASIMLKAGEVTAKGGSTKTKKGRTVVLGNKYRVKDFEYEFDKDRLGEIESVGRTNARLVAQMFLADTAGNIKWHHKPRVFDGEQFHATQALWNKNPLYDLAEGNVFTKSRDTLMFNHVFELNDPKEDYYLKAHIWIQDYIKVFYRDTVELLNTGRVSRPFQFLEYSFEYGHLDHAQFKKEARKTPVDGSKDMKLKFRVGSSQLDAGDRETMESLDSLKAELTRICRDPASELIDINFYGFSSPEGKYDKNLSLSGQRTNTVKNAVLSVLPRQYQKLGRYSKGEVASWSQVAALLEADSLKREAEEIRKIVAANPKSVDNQGTKIRGLSYYKSLILPRLEQLRVVRCEYKTIVTRKLEPEEILSRYRKDPDFKGEYEFTLNDFWNLFAMVEDKNELEKLYRKALKVSWEEEREYWILPANNLAVAMLEKKQVDTTLLTPFVSKNYRLNATPTDENGKKKLVNHPSLVMNQILMYMQVKDYEKAEELSSLLETQNPILRAIVRCLGGYIDPSDKNDKRRIDEICKSSPRNQAIINMYNERYDKATFKILNQLPKDDPVTNYLKAQLLCLSSSNQAKKMMTDVFDRESDPDFEHPEDRWTDYATEDQMNAQRKVIKKWETKVAEYKERQQAYPGSVLVPFEATLEYCQGELLRAREVLHMMETGEDREFKVFEGTIKVYDAAKVYLTKCFALDKKYIEIARRDADINEDLFNDIMGIKKGAAK